MLRLHSRGRINICNMRRPEQLRMQNQSLYMARWSQEAMWAVSAGHAGMEIPWEAPDENHLTA